MKIFSQLQCEPLNCLMLHEIANLRVFFIFLPQVSGLLPVLPCLCEALVVPLGFRRGAPSNATGCGSGIAPHDAAFALRLQDGKERA